MKPVRLLLSLGMVLASTALSKAEEPVFPAPCANVSSIFGDTNCTSTGANCSSTEGGGQAKLIGLIAPSDHGFSTFISPMSNPIYFEDPRTLTEA